MKIAIRIVIEYDFLEKEKHHQNEFKFYDIHLGNYYISKLN